MDIKGATQDNDTSSSTNKLQFAFLSV